MRKGFSLVEVLVATAILAMMMVSVLVITSSVYKSSRKAEAIGRVKSDGSLAVKSIENIVKYAKNINTCNNNSITVTTTRGEIVTYSLNTDNEIASTSATTGRVYRLTNNNNARLTRCAGGTAPIFTCATATNARTVRVCFALESIGATTTDVTTTAGGAGGVEFSTQITLRNWGL